MRVGSAYQEFLEMSAQTANNPLAGWRRSISDVSYASDRQCKSDPRYHHVHKTQKSVHDNYDMYEFRTNLYMTSRFS